MQYDVMPLIPTFMTEQSDIFTMKLVQFVNACNVEALDIVAVSAGVNTALAIVEIANN